MTQALHILRKDIRHLWPQIAMVAVVEILTARAAAIASSNYALAGTMFHFIQTLVRWYLVAAVIHEERLPGDKQYWLTRPYSWRSLLLAKTLFVLLFLNLPVMATDCYSLILRGQSPLHWLPSLLISQLFAIFDIALPVAALAVITTGLVNFTWVSLAASAAVAFTISELSERNGLGVWGSIDWIRSTAGSLLVASATLAAVLIQYRRRNTRLAQYIVALGAVLLISSYWLPGRRTALSLLADPRQSSALAKVQFQWDAPGFWAKAPDGMRVFSEDLCGPVQNINFRQLLDGDGPSILCNSNAHEIQATLLSAPAVTPLGLRAEPWPVPDGGSCAGWTPTGVILFVTCTWPATHPAMVQFRIHWLDTGETIEPLPSPFPSTDDNTAVDFAPFPTGGFWQTLQLQQNLNHRQFELALLTRSVIQHFELKVQTR